MTLGFSASVREGDVVPACFPDLNGQVFLRGHVSLFPVPAVGGGLLAILPLDPEGNCSCTPEENDVIATATGLAILDELSVTNSIQTEVCIVRVLIDKFVYADVNRDLIIDQEDVNLVENSPLFNINPAAPTKCNTTEGCGPVDVNRDGVVNQLDSTSITQSARLGTNVTCGGVYATDFSCGSTRRAPLVPAVGISLDTITYFSDDGLIVEGRLLKNNFEVFPTRSLHGRASQSMIDDILVEFGNMENMVRDSTTELENVKATIAKLQESDADQTKKIASHDNRFGSSEETIMIEVFVSVFVVIVCGVVVLAIQKKRRAL